MAVQVNKSFIPVVDNSQPSATSGLVRRDIINYAATGSSFAFTAASISSSGLTGIVSVAGTPITTSSTLACNNTTNGDGTIDFSTGTVTLTQSATNAVNWLLTVISRT